MSDIIETITIEGAEGVATRINACDFDPKIHTEYGKQKPAPAITRASIGRMGKADVVELLEAHGCKTNGSMGKMRERLISVMFVD